MCNNTTLSNFLEGVNFMEDHLPMEDEEIIMMEDDALLLLDMNMDDEEPACEMESIMSDLLSEDNTSEASCLPPLDMAQFMGQDDDDLVALMAEDALPSTPTQRTTQEQQAGLEKLAHALRQSEMALREQQRKLSTGSASSSSSNSTTITPCTAPPSPKCHNPTEEQVLQKANLFFQGRRMTITPELEKSRQEVWAIIRAHQQQQQQQPQDFRPSGLAMTGAAA